MAFDFSEEEEEMERDLVSPSLLEEVDDILTQPCQKPLEGVPNSLYISAIFSNFKTSSGIVAFVDVRSGTKSTINTGNSLEECLNGLGASVC